MCYDEVSEYCFKSLSAHNKLVYYFYYIGRSCIFKHGFVVKMEVA